MNDDLGIADTQLRSCVARTVGMAARSGRRLPLIGVFMLIMCLLVASVSWEPGSVFSGRGFGPRR